MAYTTEELRKDRVFHHFYQICQIPHPSGDEKALSDYVLHWARSIGLEATQDAVYNVLIRKPASPGYEHAPVTMLQAHLDMVCEKTPDSKHDFSKDPIAWEVEGDLLTTGGATTLGADDGVGMALAMAILEDGALCHPELEVLFTVNEEDDFTGASRFDGAQMRSDYVINLDNATETEILCGSCGGMQVDWRMPVTTEPVPEGFASYRLVISGFKGGHSGEDIHRGHGNANILLARALLLSETSCPFFLASVKGGSFRLAIPRDAEAVLCLAPGDVAALKTRLAVLEAEAKAELAVSGHDVAIALEPTAPAKCGVQPHRVISAILLIPDGIFQMNEALLGLVDTSDNLGEIYLDSEELHMVLEIRSARNSLRTYLYQRMERLATLLGGSCSCASAYPGWDFRPASRLREIARQSYLDVYHDEPKLLSLHTGLEVGYLFEKKPSIDAIAIGPNCWEFHSPTERLSIRSTQTMYRYLCNILERIR